MDIPHEIQRIVKRRPSEPRGPGPQGRTRRGAGIGRGAPVPVALRGRRRTGVRRRTTTVRGRKVRAPQGREVANGDPG